MSKAWCYGPAGEVVFLSRGGLYVISSGGSSYPEPISDSKIPDDLSNVDPYVIEVHLAYDSRDNGVHIMLTQKDSGTVAGHFWFDWLTRTYWPVEFTDTDHDPYVMLEHDANVPGHSCVIMGCRDGYTRRFRDDFQTDSGTEITSYVLIGPIDLGGNDYHEGMIIEIRGTLAERSGDIDWSILGGDSFEDCLDNTAQTGGSGTWSVGTNNGVQYRSHPRVTGKCAVIKLENGETDKAWTIETMFIRVKRKGRLKTSG